MRSTQIRPVRQLPSFLKPACEVARRISILTGRLAADTLRAATQYHPGRVYSFAVQVLRYAEDPRTLEDANRQAAIDQFAQTLHCWITQHEWIGEQLAEILEDLIAACWQWHQPELYTDLPKQPPTPVQTTAKRRQPNKAKSTKSKAEQDRDTAKAYLWMWFRKQPYTEEVLRQLCEQHFDTRSTKKLSVHQLRHLRNLIHEHGPTLQKQINNNDLPPGSPQAPEKVVVLSDFRA